MGRKLEGKVAIVTGGAAGIGYGIVERFVAEGAKAVVFDITNAEEIARKLGAVAAIQIDVSDSQAWERAAADVAGCFGGIHILVNNAAISGPLATPVGEYPPEQFQRVIAVNLIGPFNGHRYAIPHMLRSGGGAIVNISAAASAKTTLGICPYNASKAALDSLTRTAACEYATKGIRVNSVRPGMVETPLLISSLEKTPEIRQQMWESHPMHRAGTPAELAAAVTFLASDEASYITGAHLSVDGGYLAT
jgi:NAD(P)-dependent dehydrogenase (short-subunit alcohol dehydrogenase family)